MSAISVASRYANALIAEAQQQNNLEQVYQDMNLFAAATEQSKELRALLKSPIVNVDKKLSSIKAIFADKVSGLTLNFLNMLVKKRREGNFKEIVEAFKEAYNNLKNIVKVDLTSASELSDATVEKLVSAVKAQLGGAELQVNKTVDPSILGGFIIKIGDKVFDTSVQSKINSLKRELLAN